MAQRTGLEPATPGVTGRYPLTNGETVTVIVTDPAGNNSTPVTVEAPDTTAPAPATDVQVAPDGSSVTGNAEPGATVGVDTDGDGQPDTTVVVGHWSFTPSTPLADGTVVNATATDPAGNTGGQGSTTVDAIAPATPTVNLSNGSSLSGTAEPGSTVILTDGNGNPIAEVISGRKGRPCIGCWTSASNVWPSQE